MRRISNARFARLTLTERPFGWQDRVLSGDFSLIMDMWGKPLFFVSTDGVRDLVVPWENVLYAETKELATEDPR